MAYNFFPKTALEIQSNLQGKDVHRVKEIIEIFSHLKTHYPKIEHPINLDKNNLGKINITRQLEGIEDISALKRHKRITRTSMKYGNGSSGNRGIANKGNLFEKNFHQALLDWQSGETITDNEMKKVMEDLKEEYEINKYTDLDVKHEGAVNTRRPLIYTPTIQLSSDSPDYDIGKLVTDITLYDKPRGNPIVYLSLKHGSLVSFFNVGIKKVFTTQEIKEGQIKNINGKKLLDLFNINNSVFCDVFNGNASSGVSINSTSVDVWPSMSSQQKSHLETLLQSGIGYGYHVIHKIGSKIHSFKVDKQYMLDAATPKSCVVNYGGKTGTAKRIDIEIETNKYNLKLNIRDTQGSGGYPDRMMCEFTYKN